eukprot:COSAG03_NODE_355_length_8649_cov_96.396491_6_plen_103_part_00
MLPGQQKRGQKRRAPPNDGSNLSDDEATEVSQPEREYLQHIHELSRSVLVDIRSAVETEVRADTTGEARPMQGSERTRESVCLVRYFVLDVRQKNGTSRAYM